MARQSLKMCFDSLLNRTRDLLLSIETLVNRKMKTENRAQSQIRITPEEIRESFWATSGEIRPHLSRLVAMEFLVTHRNKQSGKLEYELIFRSEDTSFPTDTSEDISSPSYE